MELGQGKGLGQPAQLLLLEPPAVLAEVGRRLQGVNFTSSQPYVRRLGGRRRVRGE